MPEFVPEIGEITENKTDRNLCPHIPYIILFLDYLVQFTCKTVREQCFFGATFKITGVVFLCIIVFF